MRERFDFYGYNTPTSGKYYVDDETYFLGEDYRSVKRYKEYKNVGFNIALLQHENEYKGEDWKTSGCKKSMDAAFGAGIDKVIVSDKRLKDLCIEPLLVGEDGKFKSEEELVAYIDDCTKTYRDHPAFYGLQLFDEPAFKYLKEYAHVYRAVKKVLPNVEMQCNLLNMVLHKTIAPDPENLQDRRKDFADYLTYFQKESGINYLMTDEYAFRRNNVISPETVPVYQVLANVCKAQGVEMRLVMQSFSQEGNVIDNETGLMEGGIAWRRITERDMYWQMNLAMGFGCKEYSFFTYFTKIRKNFKGKRAVTDGIDGAAFINLDGSRTKLYYYTKRIIAQMRAFEPVILKYAYDDSYLFFPDGKGKDDFNATKMILDQNKTCPITAKNGKCPIIVTQLKNGSDSLFMVENIGNTMDELMHGVRAGLTEIDLSNLKGEINFYVKGKKVDRVIDGGKIKEKLRAGDALFIEIKR